MCADRKTMRSCMKRFNELSRKKNRENGSCWLELWLLCVTNAQRKLLSTFRNMAFTPSPLTLLLLLLLLESLGIQQLGMNWRFHAADISRAVSLYPS